MKIKKIRARNFREALSIVKRELGADAVILSSEDKKSGRSYVEVTAAIDYDIETSNKFTSSQIFSVPNDTNSSNDLLEIKNEIKNLRQCLQAMRIAGLELNLHEKSRDMFYFLKERAIKDEYALRLVERASTIDELEELMTDDLNVSKSSNNYFTGMMKTPVQQRIVMLIGPTGVGKTTTVAKLASMAIRERKKVAMISVDTFKIGAAEQIRIYSRMIGIPLDVVANVENLRKSINRFSDRDLILIDTTGQNPKKSEYIDSLKSIYETGLPIETQLLLSTSSDCEFMMDTYKYYNSLPINCMAFTKTDEAVKLGSIYNLTCLYRKPIAYITTGQKVPGNIEFVDCKTLTNLILNQGVHDGYIRKKDN
jgi:flagellar biosynthesis protein FlhF